MSKILILSDEFLARIHVGLGEIQAKFALPVIAEIQRIVDLPNESLFSEIESHLKTLHADVTVAIKKPEEST